MIKLYVQTPRLCSKKFKVCFNKNTLQLQSNNLKSFFVFQKALIGTFNTSFKLHNNLCEFTALKHKFKR